MADDDQTQRCIVERPRHRFLCRPDEGAHSLICPRNPRPVMCAHGLALGWCDPCDRARFAQFSADLDVLIARTTAGETD